MNERDQISRSDLALVLKAAAELQERSSEDEAISVSEAERIAEEVGIEPARFRAALRALRSSRVGTSGLLGPKAVLSAEAVIERAVEADEAARMLTQAHLSLPVAGVIETPATGTWRTASRSTLLQVTSQGGKTSIAAVVNRRLAKLGMIGAGTWLGTVAGFTILPGIVMALGGSVEALAAANIVGSVGGASAGFLVGRSAWSATARRTQERVLLALERMRSVVDIA